MNKKTGNILLRDALIEAMLREFDRDMEKCEESPICSPEHYKKMSEIVGFDVTKPRRKPRMRKKVIIFIIAAALALTGCVAVFYRQIGNFIEEVYEKYIKVHFVEETPAAPTEIEDVYTLTYVPEGYKLAKQSINAIHIRQEYSNEAKDTIVFEQNAINSTICILDAEKGKTIFIEHKNILIYCKTIKDKYYYLWNTSFYQFSICSRYSLDEREIVKIIEGITTK